MTKRRSSKSGRRRRKSAATRAGMKFTIQYFRKGKRTKPLTFDLSSFEQARKVARIAGEFKNTSVQSFTITSEGGRSETWFYREARGGKNADEPRRGTERSKAHAVWRAGDHDMGTALHAFPQPTACLLAVRPHAQNGFMVTMPWPAPVAAAVGG
jgi:hypothetical protein